MKQSEFKRRYDFKMGRYVKKHIYREGISGAPARASRARSGAPWVRKFGKLSISENLVMT